MSAEVKLLEIGPHLGKVKNRVALVGVELEGGWKKLPPGVVQLERDGSVFNDRIPAGVNFMGELPLGPALPAGIGQLIRDNHPSQVNATCGMHVHMSFDTLRYFQTLMIPEFQETMLHYLGLWATENKLPEKHCIWERLRGESRYCRKEFWPDKQAGVKQKTHDMAHAGHRYTAIHYCGRQNTIECRVLPMMPAASKAISAVERVIQITNACLYVLSKSSKLDRHVSKVELPENIVYEETIIGQI